MLNYRNSFVDTDLFRILTITGGFFKKKIGVLRLKMQPVLEECSHFKGFYGMKTLETEKKGEKSRLVVCEAQGR